MPRRMNRTWTIGDIEVRSKFESTVGNDLLERGVEFDYERESYLWMEKVTRAQCTECGGKQCYQERSYTPDFFLPNGIIVEAKGIFTSHDRKIAAAMQEQYPNLEIRLLFQRNNWLTRQHKSTYGDWCDRKGIRWAVGKVPEDWLLENTSD